MSIKISGLPSGASSSGTDEFPATQSGTTQKFTLAKMAEYIVNGFNSLSLGGIAQTVKSAIDTVTTALGNLSDLVGNTAMGTTATTVTGAIAEHEGDITSLNNNLNSLIIVREFFSSEVTLNAGATTTVTVSCAVTGYTLLGAIGVTTQSTEAMAIHRFYPNSAGTAVFVTLKNTYTDARTFTVFVRGIYKKS